MSDWKPGDVAMSHDEFVAYTDDHVWIWATTGNECLDQPPSSLRRIAIVDPEDREQVERLVVAYYTEIDATKYWNGDLPEKFADFMQVALREFANPKPPKPDEPTGLGAVVEDEDGLLFVRVGVTIGDFHWRSSEPGNSDCFPWRTVKAVRVLSEGVQP